MKSHFLRLRLKAWLGSEKHRLVYEIQETKVMVFILSTYGHYDDH